MSATNGGLVNMGATCYANALIQCFRNSSKLTWLLEEGRYSTLFQAEPKGRRKRQQELTRAFAEVLHLLDQCKPGQSVRPAEFWKAHDAAVQDTCYDHLATRQPHDSHESFMFLLDSLHEALVQEVEMRVTRGPPQTEQEKLVVQSLESWQRAFSKEYSPLVDMFFGLSHVTLVCGSCSNRSHRWEPFTSLKGVVPVSGQPLTLAQMLEGEMEPETISEYVCDACAPVRTEAKRIVRIWRLPQTIVVVLKRFAPDGRKIHTPMLALAPGTEFDFAAFFSEESPEREGQTRYGLRSIVDHHGSAGGGHYTSQVCRDTKWTLFDDESVHPLSAPHFGANTYMLFFERQG